MRIIFVFVTLIAALQSAVICAQQSPISVSSEPCYANGWDKARWGQLKDAKFNLAALNLDSEFSADQLTQQLRFCLADIDPEIRDGIGYFGLANWLREDLISAPVRLSLFKSLLEDVQLLRNDKQQVYLPFAVLVLSEIVRVDRISTYLNTSQRQQVLDTLEAFLQHNTDYRGFDDQQGWRHIVAHSADVLLQLVLNTQLSEKQLIQVSQIVANNINPETLHFYQFDEPHRLMRPIIYAMLREEVSPEFWQAWIADNSMSKPLNSWGEAFESKAGLAKRHNTKAFYLSLHATAVSSGSEKLEAFLPSIQKALAQF